MNQRACILALTVGTLCTASMSSYALFPTDGDASPVNGTPKTFHWGDLVTSGAGNLSFIGNRLSYTTAGATTTDSANPDFATLNWTSYAPGSASWTFELDASMKRALSGGSNMRVGVDHPNYQTTLDPVAPDVRDSLVKDLRFEAA